MIDKLLHSIKLFSSKYLHKNIFYGSLQKKSVEITQKKIKVKNEIEDVILKNAVASEKAVKPYKPAFFYTSLSPLWMSAEEKAHLDACCVKYLSKTEKLNHTIVNKLIDEQRCTNGIEVNASLMPLPFGLISLRDMISLNSSNIINPVQYD